MTTVKLMLKDVEIGERFTTGFDKTLLGEKAYILYEKIAPTAAKVVETVPKGFCENVMGGTFRFGIYRTVFVIEG